MEVFWIIPNWNKWSERRRAGITPADGGFLSETKAMPATALKSKFLDLLLYSIVALAVVTALVVYILRRP
jgi:hypothetical protein